MGIIIFSSLRPTSNLYYVPIFTLVPFFFLNVKGLVLLLTRWLKHRHWFSLHFSILYDSHIWGVLLLLIWMTLIILLHKCNFNSLSNITIIYYVIFTEICSINKQKNRNPVFRSQGKEILFSFNGRLVFLKELFNFCKVVFCSFKLESPFDGLLLDVADRNWITCATETQWYQSCFFFLFK